MNVISLPPPPALATTDRALAELTESNFKRHQFEIYSRTDRMFAWVMTIQYVLAVLFAMILSPRTYAGPWSQTHPHVWIAILLGGALAAFPIFQALRFPGATATRYVVAVSQVLFSALLIHLSGGRVETHFHVFGSLAILAIYRDWRILVAASVVVAADHFVRGIWFPSSIYGVGSGAEWRFLEHAGWVVFEDIFLIIACVTGVREMHHMAERRAELELANGRIERTAEEIRRTLEASQALSSETSLDLLIDRVQHFLASITKADQVQIALWQSDGWLVSTPEGLLDLPLENLKALQKAETAGRPLLEGSRLFVPVQSQGHCRAMFLLDGQLSADQLDAVLLIASQFAVSVENALLLEGLEQKVQERTAELREAQAELVDAARRAGMAQIATNVLHNVGNVLNSVNVSADLVNQKMRKSTAQGLSKAVALMDEHKEDLGDFLTQDTKGKQLPGYLVKLDAALITEQKGIIEELERLARSIDHIKEIVATQQSYAGESTVVAPMNVHDLVDDAIRMNSAALNRHVITVVREFDEVPLWPVDKHRVLLILVNLIANAKNATDPISSRIHEITIRVALSNPETLQISVSDNGEGITPENLQKIFSHGFTTRKEGHGFGLHSCAIAAQEMGAKMGVLSEGADKGATFTLDLPRTKA